MSAEQTIYISPLHNWRIISCEGMWGFQKYEVEQWHEHGFWQSMFDGEHSLKRCFIYLLKNNIISKDESKAQITKWCR